MTKGTKLFWGLVVLAVIIIIIAVSRTPAGGPAPSASLPEGAIKIGAVVPLTGDAAAYGIPLQRAALLAVEEINQSGGIKGHPLEIIWEDGKCEAKDATTAAQRLININQVKIIFGGACSSETLAMAPLAEAAKVLVISPSATSPDITTAGDFIFRTSPSDAAAGDVAATYAYNKMNARRAAVLSETKDYTQGLRRVFTEKFTALGGAIVADETYNTGDTDMRTQILKIKNANPDAIYILPQTPAPGVLILKQLTANGVETGLITAEVMIGRNIVEENKADMEGLIGIENWFDEGGELASSMLGKYKGRHNEDAPFPSFMSNIYSQFYLIKEGLETHGLDTEALRNWLYGLQGWEHALGSLTFDSNGDPVGLPYSVKKVENGALIEVEVFRP